MHCPTHAYADVIVAAADGRIDFAGSQALETALKPALAPDSAVRGVVVDLSNVDYISSVGLRVLMVAAKALRARKASIAVASLQPVVAEIFEISRFHHVVDVRRDVREAIGAISPPALAAYDGAQAPERP
ncbi:MAG: STAS domain-containing protein [Betaproteobacteria bacterium]